MVSAYYLGKHAGWAQDDRMLERREGKQKQTEHRKGRVKKSDKRRGALGSELLRHSALTGSVRAALTEKGGGGGVPQAAGAAAQGGARAAQRVARKEARRAHCIAGVQGRVRRRNHRCTTRKVPGEAPGGVHFQSP